MTSAPSTPWQRTRLIASVLTPPSVRAHTGHGMVACLLVCAVALAGVLILLAAALTLRAILSRYEHDILPTRV